MQHELESQLNDPAGGCCRHSSPATVGSHSVTLAGRIDGQPCDSMADALQLSGASAPAFQAPEQESIEFSQILRPGDVVLHLGSGSSAVCDIAAEIVGPLGKVIGVECQEDHLSAARQRLHALIARRGNSNVEFRKGRPHDLQLNLELLERWLQKHPARTAEDWLEVEAHTRQLRATDPLIPANSVDVVIVTGVSGLVHESDRTQLFAEIARVLKRGGRAVISDIVSDEDLPADLRTDRSHLPQELESTCREDLFLEACEHAGLHGIQILSRGATPCAVVEGIEFRTMTIQAFKGKDGPCLERNQAVIYNGPWKAVVDDDGHTLFRGKRMAVCDKTFQLYTQSPYAEDITPVTPAQEIPLSAATTFDCRENAIRHPHETKHGTQHSTHPQPPALPLLPLSDSCGSEGCC